MPRNASTAQPKVLPPIRHSTGSNSTTEVPATLVIHFSFACSGHWITVLWHGFDLNWHFCYVLFDSVYILDELLYCKNCKAGIVYQHLCCIFQTLYYYFMLEYVLLLLMCNSGCSLKFCLLMHLCDNLSTMFHLCCFSRKALRCISLSWLLSLDLFLPVLEVLCMFVFKKLTETVNYNWNTNQKI